MKKPKIKVEKSTKTQVEVFKVLGDQEEPAFECWAYPDMVFFETDAGAIRITPGQFKRLVKFVERNTKE